MAGVNKVIIVGNLGNDPELRSMPNGEAVANISVATSQEWTDKTTNEKKSETEWHRIVFFRRQAEICGEYLHKGSKVYVEGRIKTRKWQDQNGQDRYTTEIIGENLQMLDSKNAGIEQNFNATIANVNKPQSTSTTNKPASATSAEPTYADPQIDDIPF